MGRRFFERILCPLDLTPESDESLRYGIAIAKAYSAKLLVINCVDGYAVSGSRERENIKQLLDTAVRKQLRLPMPADFTWETLLVDGDPEDRHGTGGGGAKDRSYRDALAEAALRGGLARLDGGIRVSNGAVPGDDHSSAPARLGRRYD